jgi:hypothetical protein
MMMRKLKKGACPLLEPITRKVTDESVGNIYRFTFYCDLCGQARFSVEYTGIGDADDKKHDHNAAYERANIEALKHFNRCTICKRFVCDYCFRILPEGDMCKECSGDQGVKVKS